jgi:glycosyltransferase involved in cell wall biosynthesis
MRVIHYYPFGYCYPITSGSDSCICNQLNYFRTRGFEVDCVFANLPQKAWAQEQFEREYGWINSVTLLDVPWAHHQTFRDQVFLYDSARKHPAFQALWSRPADLFLTNYIFTAPLALEAPQSCRRVVEMLDLMSDSFTRLEVHHDGSPAIMAVAESKRRFLFRLEVDLCRIFDRVIMLSPTEYDEIQPHLGSRAVFIPQCVPDPGPPRDFETEAADDLLFIGSNHLPNVTGLDWFYRRVYVPYLHREGFRFKIVGGVCDDVSFNQGHLVTMLPRVEGSLVGVYRQAKLVIIPLFEGSGVSIKAIESLAMGCPTVASQVGARGLPDNSDAVVLVDIPRDPGGAARVILDLLSSPSRRQALRSAARSLYERHFHPDKYQARLDQALEVA